MSLKQTSNNAQGMQSYNTEYIRYMSTWSHLMEWKLQAYWFILGLDSSNIRSDLFARVKSGDFDKYPEDFRLARLLKRPSRIDWEIYPPKSAVVLVRPYVVIRGARRCLLVSRNRSKSSQAFQHIPEKRTPDSESAWSN